MIFEKQKGVGLIEVMVSLLLLAIAVLGFVALQASSVKATDESLIRTRAMTTMRELGDKVRYSSNALKQYSDKINAYNSTYSSTTQAPKSCITNSCTPNEVAEFDAYFAVKSAYDNGYQLGMHVCPGSGEGVAGYMQTYCLIASWNTTKPNFGNDSSMNNNTIDCMSESATYHRASSCIMMEII